MSQPHFRHSEPTPPLGGLGIKCKRVNKWGVDFHELRVPSKQGQLMETGLKTRLKCNTYECISNPSRQEARSPDPCFGFVPNRT